MCLIHDEKLTQETLARFDENGGVLQAWKLVRRIEDKPGIWSPFEQDCRIFSGWLISNRESKEWNKDEDGSMMGLGPHRGMRKYARGNHVYLDGEAAKEMVVHMSALEEWAARMQLLTVCQEYRVVPITIYKEDLVAAGTCQDAVVMKAWLHPEDYAKATGTKLEAVEEVKEKVI